MGKRILSLLLAFVMVVGMVPATGMGVFATETETAAVYDALVATSITLDGNLAETEWLTSGKLSGGQAFDILWDGDNLYFAVVAGETDTTLTVKVGEKTLVTAEKAEGAAAIEAKAANSNYGIEVLENVTLSVGESTWTGNVNLVKMARQENFEFPDMTSGSQSAAGAVTAAADGKGIAFDMPAIDAANKKVDTLYSMKFGPTTLAERNQDVAFEFVLDPDAFPNVSDRTGTVGVNNAVWAGMDVILADDQGSALRFAIANNATSGLFVNVVRGATLLGTFSLGKTVDSDPFDVKVLWKVDGSMEMLVDGISKGVVENATISDADMGKTSYTNNHMIHIRAVRYDYQYEYYKEALKFTITGVKMAKAVEVEYTTGIAGFDGKMNALFADGEPTAASNWSDSGWETFANGEGKVAALVYQQKVYLNVQGAGTGTVTAKLGEETQTAELADGAALLCFEATKVTEYGQKLSLDVKVGETAVWSATGELTIGQAVIGAVSVIDAAKAVIKGSNVTVDKETNTSTIVSNAASPMWNNSNCAYWIYNKGDLASAYDTSRDILLEQTLCITKMPIGETTGTFEGQDKFSPHMGDGYTIMFEHPSTTLSGKSDFWTSVVYPDAEGKLHLTVLDGNAELKTVALGKKLGDTFKLSQLFAVNGTMTVYVDGVEVGTVTNARTNKYNSTIYKSAVMLKYMDPVTKTEGNEEASLTVKDVTVSKVGTKALIDLEEEITPAAIFGNLDLKNVTASLPLRTSFQSAYLGEKALRWTSSNEEVVETDGTIHPNLTVDKKATLSVFLGDSEKALWSVEVIVPASASALNALLSEETMSVDGNLTELAWLDWMQFGSAVPGNIAAAWTKGNLFFAVSSKEADTLKMKINGKDIVVDLVNGEIAGAAGAWIAKNATTGVVEFVVPMDAIDFNLTDYNQSVLLEAQLLKGETAAALDAVLLNFSGNVAELQPLSSYTKDNGPWTLLTNSVGYNGTAPGKVNYVYKTNNNIDHTELVILSNEFQFDALPITTGAMVKAAAQADGFYYYFSDEDAITRVGSTICASIFTEDGTNLKLRIGQGQDQEGYVFDLGKTLGEKFRITYYWYPNNDLEIIVDGVLIGTVKNAGYTTSYLGVDVITYRYYSEKISADKVKFTVSNMTKIVKKYETVLDELTPNVVFGRMDLEHVQRDLPMVTTFASANFAALNLKWTSSDESVVATNGKITRHATEAKSSEITVYFVDADGNEIKLWSVTVTVDPMTVTKQESPFNIHAGFAAPGSIKIDGVVEAEESWLLNGWMLDHEDQVAGYYGAQWDQEYLYLLIDNQYVTQSGNLAGVAVMWGGKDVYLEFGELGLIPDCEGAIAAFNGNIVEVRIPVSELVGTAKITEYGVTIDMSIMFGPMVDKFKLNLTNVDWWATDNVYAGLPMLANNVKSVKMGTPDTPDGNQGAKQLENGWRLYDIYGGADAANPAGIRTYVLFMKMPVYENFADRTEATHIEFDFYAKALPEWEWDEAIKNEVGRAFANYGVTFSLSDKADSGKNSNVAVFGIVNTADEGLVLVVNRGTEDYEHFVLNKEVGEEFRIGLTWLTNANLILTIDGEELTTIKDMSKFVNSVGDTSFVVNMLRNKVKPASEADNMDVYLTNIGFGKAHSTENIIRNLTFDDIRGENESEEEIVSDMILPTYMTNGQLDVQYPIVWTSNDEATIDPATGKVTRPERGIKVVTLTATLDNNGTKETKEFTVIVLGTTIDNGNALVVQEDTNPFAKGGVEYTAPIFNLDMTNNSVIYVFDEDAEDTRVNLVTLTDLDEISRLDRRSLRLFVSDDNATYTEIENYKLTNVGANWYLYDFEADARYIKVHYTHRDRDDTNFTNMPGEMIHVFWNESLVVPENAAEIDAPKTTLRDEAVAITLPEGIKAEGLRVALNGEILFHYVDQNGTVYVRIPDPTTGKLQLWCFTDDIDLSNKENVYEVTYGTTETLPSAARWVLGMKAGQTFPDGSKLEVDTLYAASSRSISKSTDGGYTWSGVGSINFTADGLSSGGWGIDSKTGRLFHEYYGTAAFQGSDVEKSKCITYVFYSDDGGKTWTQASGLGQIEGDLQSNYVLSYTDITELAGNDGEGPNVDFVFPMGAQYNNNGAFCGRVAYTTDGGKSWSYSESKITYGNETAFEGGLSEATILEREDGTLVYYARCQSSTVDNFAISYSLDHGVTWLTPGLTSSVYTTNTQALMMTYDFDGFDGNRLTGSPIFMWGGNNVLGGSSYMRMPLNFAVSTNEMDTFRNIQNIFFATFQDTFTQEADHYITNPSIQQINGDDMYLAYSRLYQKDSVYTVVNNFTDWFERTKGAYDSFENGDATYEGWIAAKGYAEADKAQASKGEYSMLVKENTQLTRSVPYLQNGKLSIDLYVDANSNFLFELQPAFATTEMKCAVASARIKGTTMTFHDGTVLTLAEGWNTVSFDLELLDYKASVSINGGAAKAIAVNELFNGPTPHELGNYITYVTIIASSTVYVDEFFVESYVDAVVEATEEDKAAAEKVVDMIKDLGEITLEDEDAIAEALAAYEALTQVQKDLVDRNVPTGTTDDVNEEGALINYYDVLMEALAQLNHLKAHIVQFSISLEGNIETNYYTVLSEEVANDPNTYMEFIMPDGKVVKVPVSEATKKGEYYVFTCELAAKQMADVVKAKIVYTDGESEQYECTIKAYADWVLSTSDDQALKDLVIAMLQYGAYAQVHFGYNTDNLANAGLGEYDLSGVTAETLAKYAVTDAGTTLAKFSAISLLLNADTGLRYFFTLDESVTDFKVTGINGESLTVTERGGMHYVTVTNVAAQDLDKTFTVKINDGTETAEVSATALSYCYNMLKAGDASDEALQNLIKALYLYNQAANTYFDNRN